jgi:hypothetical protein
MIDYDGTFGADPEGWAEVVNLMQKRGHIFFLVTSRGMDTPVEHAWWFAEHGITVVYCNYRAKKTVCDEQGFRIDIWIDNDPEYITKGFID